MVGEIAFSLVAIGGFVFIFVVVPIMQGRLIPSWPLIMGAAGIASLVLFSALIVLLFPIWGPVLGFRGIRRIVQIHQQVKKCLISAVTKEEVPVSWIARRALAITVWRRAGTHGWAAINRAAVAALTEYVEARPEFSAALPEAFQPGSWFAKEVGLRYGRPRLAEYAYRMLEDRGAGTNGNVLKVLVSWETETENHWLVDEIHRREPSLEAIVSGIAGPGRHAREPGRPAGWVIQKLSADRGRFLHAPDCEQAPPYAPVLSLRDALFEADWHGTALCVRCGVDRELKPILRRFDPTGD